MNHSMAEVVQVDAFGSYVAGDEDTDWRFVPTEFLDDLLLIDIAHAAMQSLNGVGRKTQIMLEVF